MVYGIIRFIKNVLIYLIIKFKFFGKEIKFKGIPKMSKKVFFEGKNALFSNVQLGDCYLGLGTYIGHNTNIGRAKVGRFCSIGDNVRISLGIHPTHFISTHPAFYSPNKQAGFTFASKSQFDEHNFSGDSGYHVVIGNDVWIGNNVLIFDGVTVGDGAIIAANSLVNKDVEPYSIVGGSPSKFIRYRFDLETIEFLIWFKWWDQDFNWLKENYFKFFSVDDFKNNIE